MWLVDRLFGLRRPSSDKPGVQGERLAAHYLERAGYRIIDRNLRVAGVEADVVAEDPDGRTIVIVEVKTRTTDLTPPEERVDERKQLQLVRAAASLQRERRFAGRPFRFDVVAVTLTPGSPPAVRHLVAAFDSMV